MIKYICVLFLILLACSDISARDSKGGSNQGKAPVKAKKNEIPVKKDNKKLIGVWVGKDQDSKGMFDFKENNELTFTIVGHKIFEGTYKIITESDKSTVVITLKTEEENATLTGIFKNEDTLIVTRKGFPSVTLFREKQKEPSKKSE